MKLLGLVLEFKEVKSEFLKILLLPVSLKLPVELVNDSRYFNLITQLEVLSIRVELGWNRLLWWIVVWIPSHLYLSGVLVSKTHFSRAGSSTAGPKSISSTHCSEIGEGGTHSKDALKDWSDPCDVRKDWIFLINQFFGRTHRIQPSFSLRRYWPVDPSHTNEGHERSKSDKACRIFLLKHEVLSYHFHSCGYWHVRFSVHVKFRKPPLWSVPVKQLKVFFSLL